MTNSNEPMDMGVAGFIEDELDLGRWIEAFSRRRWIIVAAVAVCLAAGALLYVTTPKSYMATTTIQIDRRMPPVVSSVDEIVNKESYWDAQIFYPTQYKLLRSRGLAERTVQDLRLAQDPIFNPARAAASDSAVERHTDDALVLGSLAGRLLGGLQIRPVEETSLVEIAFVAPDPELAARVANGVAESFVQWNIEKRSETVDKASSFLIAQIEELKQEIKDKESQLHAYSLSSDIVALDGHSNVVVQRLEALNRTHAEAVFARINAEAVYHQVQEAPAETVADSFSGGLVGKLRGELLDLEQEYSTKSHTYRPAWPAMQELQAKIDKKREDFQSVVDEMVAKARDSAQADYRTALRRESALAEELAVQKQAAMQLNSAAVEYNNLKVEVETRRALLNELLRKNSSTGVANRLQSTSTSNVVIVDRALRPGGPFRPSLSRNLSLGLFLGLALGFGAVVLLELLDRTVRTPEQVERVLDVPVLGLVPDVDEGGGSGYGYYGRSGGGPRLLRPILGGGEMPDIELLPHHYPRMVAAEAYRTLRTSLLLSTAGGLRSVLVTSAQPAEGKTTTAVNLAVVLAQMGHRVLLVDSDLRRPRLHDLFRISNRQGLVNHLTAGVDPGQLIAATEVPDLTVLPAGPTPPNPSELLSSRPMRDFATAARLMFDMVIYDSPPVIPVADATVLGTLVDGVVLTVGAGMAKRETLIQARERLSLGESRVIGVVVNRFRPERAGYQQDYVYRGYSAADEDDSGTPPGRGRRSLGGKVAL